MNGKRFGFTVVELLTTLAIISMLVALLIPSLNMVRNMAKETRQKAQFATIGQALLAFRTDYGDYPPSEERDMSEPGKLYCGAQKLAEALLGWDLLGFQPRSQRFGWKPNFRSDGLYTGPGPGPGGGTYDPLDLVERRGPYLNVGSGNAFRMLQLFDRGQPLWGLEVDDRFVICDSFGVKKVTIPVGSTVTTITAGTPILYYRAITSNNDWGFPVASSSRYDYTDNLVLYRIPALKNQMEHPLSVTPEIFYSEEDYKIVDQQIFRATGRLWPHRPDSYILISAGADGLYGTNDDITNFDN